jgi:hypothetical protein
VFEFDRLKTILCLALLSAACNIRIAGNDGEMVIHGLVLSPGGVPVSGATLTADNVTAVSDGGEYLLHLPGPNSRVPISVTATGFAPTVAVVEQRPGVFHYHRDVVLQPPLTIIPGADGGTVSLASGSATIFVSFGGNVVPFAGHLEVATFTPEVGPGSNETSDDGVRLQSLGLVHLACFDAAGHDAPLGSTVSFSVIDAPSLTGADPQRTYTLSDDGIWQPASTGDPTGMFVATAPGFWQAGHALKVACAKGTLVAPNRSCAGDQVTASVSAVVSFDTVGAGGTFCVEGPPGATQAVLTAGATTKVIAFPATPGSCSNISGCMDLGAVSVTDDDCAFSCLKAQTDDPVGCLDGGR